MLSMGFHHLLEKQAAVHECQGGITRAASTAILKLPI
jgi:hypothetical protein